MSVVIVREPADLEVADALGARLAEKFSLGSGPYGSNTREQHAVGKRGELAVERWVRSFPLFFIPYFRDIDNCLTEPDLRICSRSVDSVNLEVKAWREHNWVDFGRCVAVEQGDRVAKKSHAVLWCVILEGRSGWDYGDMTPNVRIEGWSTPDEIDQSPEVESGPKKIKNRQVALAHVRSLDSLVTKFGL